MIKKGTSLYSLSVIDNDNYNEANKTASMIALAKTKIGLQSLYADPEQALKKYTGSSFDIAKEMEARQGTNLLWVRARAIDGDVINANGDYFSKEELLKEHKIKDKEVPSYKTFEGVPIYSNHKNDDIEQAKGMVVYAEWDEDEGCVFCTFFVDEDAYPDIARGIRQGYIHDVSMGCFVAGTQVLTDSGYKNIEFINHNDNLISLDGNFTKIKNKQIKLVDENIHELRIEGGIAIKCTSEHPFLGIHKQEWNKRSKRKKENNKSIRVYNEIIPNFIEAKNLQEGDLVAIPIGGETVDSNLTIEQARLLGLFIAEGNYIKYKNEIKEIEFTFCIDEELTLVQECQTLLKNVFGVEARVYTREPKSIIVLRVYSEEIAKWFKYHCGEYSNGKALSKELRFASTEIQINFITAWLSGDGKVAHKTKNSQSICGVTCSLDLAQDLTYILTRLGIYHKIYGTFEQKMYYFSDAIKMFNGSKGFNGKQMYFSIEIPSYESTKIADLCGFNINATLKSHKNHSGNYILRRIQKNNLIPFKGLVYNFETDSNTYIVQNIGVHNCKVELGECSICGNKATKENEYCDCLKKHKGKNYPGTNKPVFEYNFDIKFIELSVVGDGAFESCEIQELYDPEEILAKSQELQKSAESVSVVLAKAKRNQKVITAEKRTSDAYKELLDAAQSLVKVAQSAGTLIGGQIIPGNTINNASVNSVLRGLGIDSSSGLSVLDLLNLALNFLEVSVLNLFSRKDNIDLGHVGKITKSMADLQNTLQDMIDDGIDTGGPKQQPLNQGTLQQPMNPQAPQQQQAQQSMPTVEQSVQSYVPGSPAGVGKLMTGNPGIQQQYAYSPQSSSIGGGISLAASDLYWSDDNTRVVMASIQQESNLSNRFITTLDKFIQATNIKISRKEKTFEENKNSSTFPAAGGNIDMDHFKKIAQNQREKLAKKLTVNIEVEDGFGNQIVLSSKNGISAFRNGKKASWEPMLSEIQLAQVESGDVYRVASELLGDFAKVREEALEEYRDDFDHLKVVEDHLQAERSQEGHFDVLEKQVSKKHDHVYETTPRELELCLKEDAGLYAHQDVDKDTTYSLIHALDQRDVKDEDHLYTLEQLLGKHGLRKSSVPANKVVSATINALARAVFAARVTPEEILVAAKKLSERKDLLSIFTLASIKKDQIKLARKRNQYFGKFAQALPEDLDTDKDANLPSPVAPKGDERPDEAIVNEMVDSPEKMTPQDMIDALNVLSGNLEAALQKVESVASSLKGQFDVDDLGGDNEGLGGVDKKDEMATALMNNDDEEGNDVPETNSLKAAISGMSMASTERSILPLKVIEAINEMDPEVLHNRISKARTSKATTARLAERERIEYFNINVKTASKVDIEKETIGWLADYANYYKVPTASLVNSCVKVAQQPLVAERIITSAIKNKKEASVKLTENTSKKTTIMCRVEDIEGADVKSPEFEDTFKEFAIQILSKNGYHVDPGTFTLNHIDITEGGDITATVESTVNKTVSVDQASNSSGMTTEISSPVDTEGSMSEAPELVMTASAKEARQKNRLNIIKQAQAAPGVSGQPMGGQDFSGANTPPMGAGSDVGGGLGLSSLTGSAPGSELNQDATDAEEPTAEPGTKKPWGTICPQCGSTDVDVANGEGDCNSCHAHLKFKLSVDVVPSEGENKASETHDAGAAAGAPGELPPAPEMAPGGEAAGAAFPAPVPGAGGPQVAGMPQASSTVPLMIRVSYLADSDVFVKTASSDFNKYSELRLPVGMICPSCGSRNPENVNNKTYCTDCGTIAVTSRKASKNNPGKLISTITWLA